MNKKIGSDYEQRFCMDMAKLGYWVHNLANRQNGQPADVIAVKNGKAYLIDCKVCKFGVFEKRRIEYNQHSAMTKWEKCGNGTGLFALLVDNKTYLVRYTDLIKSNYKSVDLMWIHEHSISPERLEYEDKNK